MLTPEELEPDDSDLELGRRLVAEGWKSVSTNRRRVRRWLRVAPPLLTLLPPEWHEHPVFVAAKRACEYHGRDWGLREPACDNSPDVESMDLTVRQWQAFKRLGGKLA